MDTQTILQALLLGLIEGLTEFIPVSSTGHLLLAELAMGISEDPMWKTFTVVIQLGAILAVVALYFTRLWNVLITLPTRAESRRFAFLVSFFDIAPEQIEIIEIRSKTLHGCALASRAHDDSPLGLQ